MTSESPADSNSWWSSLLTTAREKSVSALSATKRDLAEFVTVLGSDTKTAVSGATTKVQGLLQTPGGEKGGLESRQESQRKTTPHSAEVPTGPYDRSQAQLFAVQKTLDTYLLDPNDDDKRYSEWKSKFDVQAHQSEISQLLVNCSHIRTLHAQLVPAQVSYESFWLRYLYKVQLLQQEEERRAELMARAKPREQHWQWDEDTDDAGGGGAQTNPGRESEHHRSESSDSFVCVSEEPPNGSERGQDRADTESWESVGLQEEKNHEGEKEEEKLQAEKPQAEKSLAEEPQAKKSLAEEPQAEKSLAEKPQAETAQEMDQEDKVKEKTTEEETPQAATDHDSDWENWDD